MPNRLQPLNGVAATVANIHRGTNGNPMFLTLGEAAKHSGLSKATVSRAIRDGKLSAQKSPDTGSYKIDPAELHRYTEATKVLRATGETEVEKHPATVSMDRETLSETAYETRLQEMRERIELEARAKM